MPNRKNTSHTLNRFPLSRIFTEDVGRIGMKKHHIKAVIEADVTESRRKLREYRSRTGNRISFTAWLLKRIADAVTEYPAVHGIRKGKRKLFVFDDVDMSVVVERTVDGEPVPLPMVIRNVQSKSGEEITSEIESAKQQEIRGESDYVLQGNRQKRDPVKFFAFLPQFLRLIIWRIILSDPFHLKEMMGTVIVSAVGMMGKVKGWFVPYSMHPLSIGLGSITEKPAAVHGTVQIREFISITLLIDHDVIDGAPAARFVSRLVKTIENAKDL